VSTSSWFASNSENVVPEVLWEDGERVCRRMRSTGPDGARREFVAVFPALEVPSPESINRLTHEYDLKDYLDSAWAVRPIDLVRERGQTLLVIEHPAGEPLSRLIGPHMVIEQFLRIAVALSAAVGRLHGRGLIHKDIKPSNILVNSATGKAWLTGFGIASRLPRERQAPVPPGSIAGTLAYMSPEQTGRMNRSIDTRSDLYSLGVTLYQILTGVLPFAAADPLEWVHCHIARQPVTPADRRAIPEPLSAITMKLLAKNAEERYQTAAGLEADLRRCLAEWQTKGRIDSFRLGSDDLSDQLLIPEKLYGREREVDALLATFDRVVAGGRPELVLVFGYSGIGKSAVVNELHKSLVPPRGLFASGKFDQYKRDIPHATLAQAFQSLIRPLLSKPEVEFSKWRDDLHQALSPNGSLLVDLVPELKLIIGEQPAVVALPPQEAKTRSHLAFRRFISVFARPEHPLALFLDDLQWLDAATLDFLEDLLVQQDLAHLLVVGACRDNEVDAAHPLMRKLSAIREAGGRVQEIRLAPLSSSDLAHLVTDTLHCESQAATSLAQLIHDKTAGNPFFAIQFIYALVEEGLITFDHGDTPWCWDLDAIRVKGYTDNVVDLIVAKLNRLPATTQRALQQFACIGNSADAATLSAVLETSEQETESGLWEALHLELIVQSEDSYRFVHDRVQEAAYSLIAKEVRAEAHLRIGRLLHAHTPPEKREEVIFEIVNQFNRGAVLITSEDERFQLAELNLVAGKRAKASTAHASALQYSITGAALLTNECWERRHDLIFQLELHRAECEFLTGEVTTAAERMEMLRSRASNAVERAMATCLGIDVCLTLGQIDRAVAIGLDYLHHLAIEWPLHPTEEQARSEYGRIWSQLGSREIEEVMDFPLMSDPTSITTLDVLTKVLVPAFFTDMNLFTLVICAAVSLSIERGNNDGSCLIYVWIGYIAGHRFGDYKNAFRFAQLGYDLVEKRGLKRFQAGAYHTFAHMVMPWMKHPFVCSGVIRQAFEIANKIGDLTYAVYSRMSLISLLIAAGHPLAVVQSEAENGLNFAQKAKFAFGFDTINMLLGFIRTLRGLTTNFGSFDHAEFDEIDFERNLNNHLPMAQCWYWVRKLQVHFFAGDFASAIEASLQAQPLLLISPGLEMAEYEFYSALARAACCDSATAAQSWGHFETLGAHYERLQVWAEHCPENFEDRATLVAAEIARIEGRELDAERLYEKAIRSARENNFVHNEALAHEVAAQFYAARGFETFADAYLRNARNCYERWGAHGKVKQLDERYPRLREGRTPASSATIGPLAGHLDVETVVKASQALSSEMVLPRLIEKLLRIAVEHAGAERGLLILIRDGERRIEAEATTSPSRVEIAVRQVAVTSSDLPQSALHYVIRTQESVLLDDALSDNVYSKDEYVRQKRSRSLLCLPIVKQKKLVGALYLENNLAPFAFTPDRVTLLHLLASQAAISLENAALYSDLQLQAGLLQNLPVSAWTLKPDGTPDFVNQVWLDYSGQTPDFLRSYPEAWTAAVHPKDREAALRAFWGGIRSGQSFAVETRSLRAQDGIYRWHLNQAVVLRDAEGKVLRFIGTTTDIDDQKRAEEALRESEHDLRLIIDTMPVLAWSAWPDGRVDFFNQRWLDYTGLSPAQAQNWGWALTFHPDDQGDLTNYWQAILATGESGEIEARLRRFDGDYRWFLFRAEPLRDGSGSVVKWYGTNTDIEDRKQGEEALRESEQSFRLILDGIAGFVAIMSATGETEVVNRQALEYFGRTAEQLKGWSTGDAVHPDDLPGVYAAWMRSVETVCVYDVDHRLRRTDGVYRWFHARGLPLCDSQGRVLRWYVLLTDIDDRKRAEEALRQAQSDLARINRVTTMGELAASLAHEVSQPISGAMTNANVCLRKLGSDKPDLEEVRGAVTRIVRDAQRAADIVGRIRSQFEKGALNREVLDVNEIIRETVAVLRSEAERYNISARTELAADLPQIIGDRVQLQQVTMNLIINSLEAMKEVGGMRELAIKSQRGENEQVLVTVSDTGVGFPPQLAEQIFDPFFTTKPRGTGMGLRISRSIIEAHGGRLRAAANDGPGATFAFSVPCGYTIGSTREQ
jgi:PAS domain S-box-containing protein